MKREHWPEVGWRRRRAWAEAWAGTARLEQRLQDGSTACFDRVGQGRGWAGSGEAERWELWLGLATAWDVTTTAWAGDGVGRRWLGLWLATATAGAGAGDGDGDGFGFGVEGRWKLDERWGLMREIGGMRSLMRDERAWWDDEKKRKRLQRARARQVLD